jgi:hypothetical protein
MRTTVFNPVTNREEYVWIMDTNGHIANSGAAEPVREGTPDDHFGPPQTAGLPEGFMPANLPRIIDLNAKVVEEETDDES